MSANGSTYKRCGCTDPGSGKQLGAACPDIARRRHRTWTYEIRIDVTRTDGRKLKRGGFERESDASSALDKDGRAAAQASWREGPGVVTVSGCPHGVPITGACPYAATMIVQAATAFPKVERRATDSNPGGRSPDLAVSRPPALLGALDH